MTQDKPSGLKALTFGYRDFNLDEFEAMKKANNNFEDEESRGLIESQLTLLASVGLSDPLRDGIGEAIEKLVEGRTNVRLVSGDHRASVLSTAISIGLVEEEENE